MPLVEIRPTILEIPEEDIEESLDHIAPLVKTLHVDIEDGSFVSRKTQFDLDFIKWVKETYHLVIDMHLMVQNPQDYVSDYLKAGAEIISFHFESEGDTGQTINKIIENNAKACLALKLETEVEKSQPFFSDLAEILLMSVTPGFGGQEFEVRVLDRITQLRKLGFRGKIKIDGGIKVGPARQCAQNGADILVCGTALFDRDSIEEAYLNLVNDIKGGSDE